MGPKTSSRVAATPLLQIIPPNPPRGGGAAGTSCDEGVAATTHVFRSPRTQLSVSAVQPVEERNKFPEVATLDNYCQRFVGFMGTDDDAQAIHGLRLLEALLAGGNRPAAEQVAGQISGYRRAVAYCRIGVALAMSDPKGAEEYLEKAHTERLLLADWQRLVAQVNEALLMAALGHFEEASKALEALPADPARGEARARIFEFAPSEETTARLDSFVKEEGIAIGWRGTALLSHARRQIADGKLGEGKNTLNRAANELSKRGDLPTVQSLGEVSRDFLRTGDVTEALRWAKVCEGFAERFPVENGWRAQGYAVAARAFGEADSVAEAKKLLSEAAKAISGAESLSYGEAAMSVADAAVWAGELETGKELFKALCNAAGRQPHHRAKAMGAISALCWIARNHLPLDETMRTGLDALAEAIKTDPHAKG